MPQGAVFCSLVFDRSRRLSSCYIGPISNESTQTHMLNIKYTKYSGLSPKIKVILSLSLTSLILIRYTQESASIS